MKAKNNLISTCLDRLLIDVDEKTIKLIEQELVFLTKQKKRLDEFDTSNMPPMENPHQQVVKKIPQMTVIKKKNQTNYQNNFIKTDKSLKYLVLDDEKK